ncbi:MAG: DUF72 domain-containing protein [Candidatus Marinimicrobia bacterium]|nr:DUF72 domain-containing protein [Candidatus Neomarinimicrobiota bacterium]
MKFENKSLHIGACSWKYDSWEGLVYDSAKPENYLKEYAAKYDTVEIDQWFWSLFGENQVVLPKKDIVEEYAATVPDDFRFSIKVPNSLTLTHFYKKQASEPLVVNPHFLSVDLFHRFLESIEGLLPKLGSLIFQFEYLNKQKMNSQTQFLELLNQFLSGIQFKQGICIEIRNPYYLNLKYFELLQKQQIGHGFCQGYYMPPITEVYEKAYAYINGTNVIRLLGPDRQGIEKTTGKQWNKVVAPKDDEIPGIVRMIRRMVDHSGMDLYLNVNNHYEGSAPVTIAKFYNFLNKE